MHVTVAVLAGGGDFSGGGDLGVNAVRVALAFIGMALVASDFFWRGVVRDAANVGVTIDTGKCAVDGVLEFGGVDGDAMAVARGHGGVGVAGEAVGVLELLRGGWGGGPGKTQKDERKRRKPANKVHALRRRLAENPRRDCSHRDGLEPVACSWIGGEGRGVSRQGLKPRNSLGVLAARLKSCPDTKPTATADPSTRPSRIARRPSLRMTRCN